MVRFTLLLGAALALCLVSYTGVGQTAFRVTNERCMPPATRTAATGAAEALSQQLEAADPVALRVANLAPGLFVLWMLLLPVLWVHCLPPPRLVKDAEKLEEEPEPEPEPAEPLTALREALQAASPGATIAQDAPRLPAVPAEPCAWPANSGVLLRQMLDDVALPPEAQPYRAQRDVVTLTHGAPQSGPLGSLNPCRRGHPGRGLR